MPTDATAPKPANPSVATLFARVAAERGLDFEPAPAPVIDALPELTGAVEDVAARCGDDQKRRWLAAALALARHVQASSLPADSLSAPDGPDPLRTPRPGAAVVATSTASWPTTAATRPTRSR